MNQNKKRFQRKVEIRNYKRIFYLFTEGSKTEPKYFNIFRTNKYQGIHLQIKSHPNKSHPKQVLKRAKQFIKGSKLENKDQAWLVIDHDERPEEDFQELNNWCNGKNYFLAISKPCFEFWLLLHFEKGDHIKSMEDCLKKLKKYLPHYTKNQLDIDKLKSNIPAAIQNAKNKFKQTAGWQDGSYTKVYELIENIHN